ncbi:histidine phosphatase family protein [Brevibacillus dissolubilis]|uniref:histidine phosphatase family protein n=1 Tax=Brevibacillus dissolubilis TaxID=1844116 RepID=UPI0011166FAF|nr:histidine phosphatase family protein [Brevibacillus dissolubilis]
METFLYLIRHGETSWNVLGRIQGHSDIELNETGLHQAKLLAGYLAGHKFDHIYTSDLKRAHVTAKAVADVTGTQLTITAGLRERSFGEWEGLTPVEIEERKRANEAYETSYGIESFTDMQKRAHQALGELVMSHPGKTIAAVSHGGLINGFLHYITEGKQGTGISRIDNTGISILRFALDKWEVVEINRTHHLPTDPFDPHEL